MAIGNDNVYHHQSQLDGITSFNIITIILEGFGFSIQDKKLVYLNVNKKEDVCNSDKFPYVHRGQLNIALSDITTLMKPGQYFTAKTYLQCAW